MTTIESFRDAVRAQARLVENLLGNVDRTLSGVIRDSYRVARDSQVLYRAAAEQGGAARDLLRGAPRFARIVGDGARLIGSYRLHREIAEVMPADEEAARRERLHEAGARRMHALCEELRGGVLKLGQFASCRMDLLPPAYGEALAWLQDRVPPVDHPVIAARLEEELGAPVDELFACFDPDPIAAASLAQVHAARLHDGTEVAVKVRVPGIDEVVEVDIAALRLLSHLAGDLIPGDTAAFARELARSLRDELDYVAEADNAEALARCFAGDSRVLVPRVVPERSAGRVITLERVHGSRLTDFLERAGAEERDRVLGTLLDAFCAQVLTHGVLHADPHPGNFLVTGDLRLALLDFGAVKRYTPELRRGYADLAVAVLSGDAPAASRLLTDMGFATRDGSPDSLLAIAETLLEVFREGTALGDVDTAEQLSRAFAVAGTNPIAQVPEHFVMLGRVFAAIGGLFARYRPQLDLAAILAPHLSGARSGASTGHPPST